MSRALSACAVVGDFLRTAEGVVEFKRNPDVLLEDAVLHDHVMVWLEEAGLALIVEHDRLAVVGKQLPEARVAGELRAAQRSMTVASPAVTRGCGRIAVTRSSSPRSSIWSRVSSALSQ